RDLGLTRSRFDDLVTGRYDLSATARATAGVQQMIDAAGGLGAIRDKAALASATLNAAGGIDAVMRRRLEMDRSIAALG
ncbi:hypothetical protein, partial [Mesorhizobium sp.]|uniref:hypothetical protein n=1 Tax=Mesorhizobium sp. TaxID=1871066 RepID=UPI00257E8090